MTSTVQTTLPMVGGAAPLKLRVLMLHSFRTGGSIFKEQMRRAELDQALGDSLEMIYLDAPNAASGPLPPDVEPFFPAPEHEHFEWWSADKNEESGKIHYDGIDRSISFLEQALVQHAPVHGLIGFSQGSALASLLISLQQRGAVLQNVAARLRFCILFAGTLSRQPEHRFLYSPPIKCKSAHVIGERDALRPYSEKLAECFVDPVVIRHSRGHVIPRLPAEDVQSLLAFVQRQTQVPSSL